MKSIFKRPHLKAEGSRNAFNVSGKDVFHAPFGALIPFFCRRVNPNDYLEIGSECQTIVEPLAAPAFMRLKEHIDYFFVPYAQLWSPFDNFWTQQDQYRSSSVLADQLGNKIPNTVPMMTYAFIKKMLVGLSSTKDEHGFPEVYGAIRLLDGLRYGNFYGMLDTIDDPATDANTIPNCPDVNPFALLAYQKIYFDYYRNTKYEECKTDAYNIDQFNGFQIFRSADADVANYGDWFRLRYRWMKKDYFTSVQPNVLPDTNQIGFQSFKFDEFESDIQTSQRINKNFGVPGAEGRFYQGDTSTSTSITEHELLGAYEGSQIKNEVAVNAASTMSYDSLSPARIRLMFAYDRYLRRLREAGGSFNAQMLAIYGVKPNESRFGNVVKIGGQTNRLFLNDVTNVSETGDYGLGSLGGNINSYNQPRSTFKYHCKEAGLVIGIYSTSIDNDYPSFMIDRMHTSKGRFDWFTPQFQDLGLQALFRYELNYLDDNDSQLPVGSKTELDPSKISVSSRMFDVLGYQRRYAEYKQGFDLVHGLFASKILSPELSVWVAKWMPRAYDGHVQVSPLAQYELTYNPSSLNDVTNVEYDGTPQQDQFKVHHFTHFKLVSNMSVIGENF